MSRRRIGLGLLAFVLAIASTAAAVLAAGSSGSAQPGHAVAGAARVAALLDGIPQHGTTLGSPDAPVTLVEFADPQCPYCGMWARDALPSIVTRYVRPGKVRIVFHGLSFLGPDSVTALRTALAAGQQNRLWNVLELLYENQGTENSGWVTDRLLHEIGATVPGLDVAAMLGDRSSTAVDRAAAQATAAARQTGVQGVPSFAVGRTGGALRLVEVTDLGPSSLDRALDAALRS